jgi:hypothetical protein
MSAIEDYGDFEGYESQEGGIGCAGSAVPTGRTLIWYVSMEAENSRASIVDHGRFRTTIKCPWCFVMSRDDA